MNIEYCDICGQALCKPGDRFHRYKLKKEWYSWYESGWDNLVVHDDCWKSLCNFIRESREITKEKKREFRE